MATKKFGGPSPYTLTLSPPTEDYVYAEYLNNVNANHQSKSQKPAVVGALFGMGRAGAIHMASIINNPRIILKYIVDDQPERFKDLKKYWNILDDVTFLTSKDADKVYKDKLVNVVFIVSPTHTHYNIIVNAVSNNKDVFCEKPVAENIENTRKCFEAAKANGRILLAAYHRRFDPACRNLRDRIRRGEIGHVQILKFTSRDCPPPNPTFMKTSGGIFHDFLVHDFDTACWALGELPSQVYSTASALIPEIEAADDFDTVLVTLKYPSGTIFVCDNSRFSPYGSDFRLEAFGQKGMIKIENERPCSNIEMYYGLEGVKGTPVFYSFPSRFKAAYKNELEHFLDVVQDGVQPEVTSWQCLAVSKLASAAEESARTGKVVQMDWSKDSIPEQYS